MTQQSLFTPTAQGEQLAAEILARSISRRTYPETSKQAAHRAAESLAGEEGEILDVLRAHGPQTIREIAAHFPDSARWYFVAGKRLPRMARSGLVMLCHDDTGHDVVRDGGRVWQAVEPRKEGDACGE